LSSTFEKGRGLKKKVLDLLQAEHFEQSLDELRRLPGRVVVNSLFSYLLNKDEMVRWKAITAMGVVVGNLAQQDMEGARTIMRRLMWSLNEESGGIGWGAPESMAEIMACHEGLAREYGKIFISYLDEQGNYIEYEALQRGLLWGLVRLATVRPAVVWDAAPHILQYLRSPDSVVRGLAARAAGLLRVRAAGDGLNNLLNDNEEFDSYDNITLVSLRIKELARDALALLAEGEPC